VAGLTSSGLTIKRLQDVRDEITERLITFFGEDINTTEDSVFGQTRDSVAPGESSIWEQLQVVYDSQFPSRAEGQQLDDNCGLVGVFRLSEQKSTVRASITGVNGTILPVGFTVAINTTTDEFDIVSQRTLSNLLTTETLVRVVVVADSTAYTVTIDGIPAIYNSDGSATEAEIVAGLIIAIPAAVPTVTASATINGDEILITSVDPLDAKAVELDSNLSFATVTSLINMQAKVVGAVPAPIDQLLDIKTNISGVNSSTNKEEAKLGNVLETDEELRLRRNTELSKTGATSVNAIADRVDLVEDVRSTVVLENFTDSIDGNSLTPHSIKVIVDGGSDADVALAIFNSKPVGTDMNGAESVAVVDSMGISRNVLFDRPTGVTIYIEVTLTKFGDYPSDGDNQIIENLVEFGVTSLFAGDDVITSRLYTPVNAVQGHQVDSLFISKTPSPTVATPITISLTELAEITAVNITIV
jgi:uncharacterized phage protein gp47/JayE